MPDVIWPPSRRERNETERNETERNEVTNNYSENIRKRTSLSRLTRFELLNDDIRSEAQEASKKNTN